MAHLREWPPSPTLDFNVDCAFFVQIANRFWTLGYTATLKFGERGVGGLVTSGMGVGGLVTSEMGVDLSDDSFAARPTSW